MAKNKLQGIAKKKVAKISGKNIFPKNIRKNKSTILTKNKLQRIAKNKLQIGKFVKNHSNSSSNKSLTFLLVCRNLPGKANLKMRECSSWVFIWD